MSEIEHAAEASEAKTAERMPAVGDSVTFYPRPGELRPGRGRHAAIVTAVNDDGSIDLVVIFDYDDLVGQRRCPRRSLDGGMGWELKRSASADTSLLEQQISYLRDLVGVQSEALARLSTHVYGKLEMPEGESVLSILDEHEDRIAAAEKATRGASAPKPAAPKQRKGSASAPTT